MNKLKMKAMSRLAKCLILCLFICGGVGLAVGFALSSITIEMNGSFAFEAWEYVPYNTDEDFSMLAFTFDDSAKTASVASATDTDGNKIASGAITIPGKIRKNGDDETVYQVTTISALAFKKSDTEGCGITSMTISEGVTTIESEAFHKCSDLTSVSIPSTVSSISDWHVFAGTGLTSIEVAEGNDTYFSYENGLYTTKKYTTTEGAIYNSNNEGQLILHSGCKNTVIKDGTVVIGAQAFAGHTGFSTINIPSSVKYISRAAFADTVLTSVTLPSSILDIGNCAFHNCQSLASITINEGCETIGTQAFFSNIALTSITIPASMEIISANAFLSSGLTSATFADGKDWMAGDKFLNNGNMSSPSRAAIYLKDSSFVYKDYQWTHIPTIGSTAIKDLKFSNFSSGTCSVGAAVSEADAGTDFNGGNYHYQENTLFIPSRVRNSSGSIYTITSIPDASFQGCSGVSEILFPDTLQSIGSGAFYAFNSVEELTVPASVTSLASDNSFMGMRGLKSLDVVDGNSKYYSSSCAIYEGTTLISGCNGTSTIKSGTTVIGTQAFRDSQVAGGIKFPASVTTINESAFMGSSLEVIILDERSGSSQLSKIGQQAFFLSGLNTIKHWTSDGTESETGFIDLPDAITSIAYQAFYSCSGITKVVIGANVTVIGQEAFRYTGLTYAKFVVTRTWRYYHLAETSYQTILSSVLEDTALAAQALRYSETDTPNGICDKPWWRV